MSNRVPQPTRSIRRPYLAVFMVVIALLLLAEVAARVWVGVAEPEQLRWYDAPTQLRADAFDETGARSIVFAGTSMAWQGFVPSQFSASDGAARSSFNAGLAGGVPVVTEPWLLHHVVPAIDPDVVVWGLSSLDFSSSYGEANYEAWNRAAESKPGVLGAIDRNLAGVSELVRWRATLRDPSAWLGFAGNQVSRDLASARAILGADGERLDFHVDFSPRRAAIQRSRLGDMRLDVSDVSSVLRTIAGLREQGIEVVLVQLPIPSQFVELHPHGIADVERVRTLVEAIGIDTGSKVIDLTDGFTDQDFVDFTHLNADAANRLTIALVSALNS